MNSELGNKKKYVEDNHDDDDDDDGDDTFDGDGEKYKKRLFN
jgi:hypothetical protein